MIEIRDLYKYYGDRRAVGPLSATIEKGEIVGLLGLNGAGKTTTLRILACDLLPTSGTVRVGGLDVVDVPHEVRRRIGYLPDTPPVYLEMTVDEYLTFAAKLRGVTGADVEKRVDEALELTEVGSERDRPIGALSHGYRQRVGIAQAIVHKPEFVVLDEPISGLDPVQIVEMRDLVRSLGGEHTVVVSSHNLQELEELCDASAILDKGKLISAMSMSELTGQLAEFRVQIAKGEVPLLEVKAQSGVKDARLEANKVLCVTFDGQAVQPEEIITRVVGLLAQRNVLFLTVWRGKKLEEKVLQLT